MVKLSVTPKSGPGDCVHYEDRQSRAQTGVVRGIEARWDAGFDPLVIYRLSHPTYRGRTFYAVEGCITGRAALAEEKQDG